MHTNTPTNTIFPYRRTLTPKRQSQSWYFACYFWYENSVKWQVLFNVEAIHTSGVIRDHFSFPGTSCFWAGFVPNARRPRTESNSKALAGLRARSTSYVHGDILRAQ